MKRFIYDQLDSTQEEAKRLVTSGQLSENALILSHHQTQGKGTQGRHWVSKPNGGWYLTFVHFELNGNSLPLCPHYTLLAAQACAEELTRCFDFLVTIKPVNDLIAKEKKLGGILIESVSKTPNKIDVLYTGIGINIEPVETENLIEHSVVSPISLVECGIPRDLAFEKQELFLKQLTQSLGTYYQTLLK